MKKQKLISIQTVCTHYEIEVEFVETIHQMGLIELVTTDRMPAIHEDQINDLEKIIRLHQELHVNLEGIDIVFNLLAKEKALKAELNTVRNRLRLYENT